MMIFKKNRIVLIWTYLIINKTIHKICNNEIFLTILIKLLRIINDFLILLNNQYIFYYNSIKFIYNWIIYHYNLSF